MAATVREPSLTGTVRVAGVRSGHAREPTGAAAAAPPDQREDDGQPAGRRARGVGAHDLPGHRGAVRAPGCRSTPRRVRAGASGSSTATAPASPASPPRRPRRWRCRACPGRPRSSGSARCSPPPSSRSTPRCRPSCAAGPCGCASASTSTRPAGSPARSRSPTSPALCRAVWEEQRVEIRYRKRDGEVKRLLDPLGLVLKAGVWYLVALSGRTRSLRTFRVSRVQSVRSLDERGAAPRRLRPGHPLGRGVGRVPRQLADQSGAGADAEELLWLVRYVQDPRSAEAASRARPSPTPRGGSRSRSSSRTSRRRGTS